MPRIRLATLAGLVLAAASVAPAASAQGSLQMLVGFGGDNTNQVNSVPVAGIYDLSHDGKVDPTTDELFALMRKVYSINGGNGAFMYDGQHIVEQGDVSFYYADAGDGYVLRAIDGNANGVLEDAEVKVFAQFGTSKTFGPNTLALTKVGASVVVYTGLNTDSRRQAGRPVGIWRSEDKNNNGSAADSGETTLLLDSASALVFAGKAGNVSLASDNWERLRTVPMFGNIVGWNRGAAGATIPADAFCYYGFQETAGKLSKHWVFFNPSRKNGLPENADIGTGSLEDLDLTFVRTQTEYYNGWDFLEVDQNGDRGVFPAYYFTNSYGAARTFGSKNAAGKALHGVVLRGVDVNRDGDLQDDGEVTVFFNGSGNDLKGGRVGVVKAPTWQDPTRGAVNAIDGFVTGLAEGEGVVYVMVENGRDSVLALTDKNNNQVIETGEAVVIYETPQPFPPVFSKQYGPYSLELHAIDRSLVVDPLPAGSTPFGKGCLSSDGLDPRTSVTGGGPVIGNANQRLELKRGIGGTGAILWLGFSNKLLLGTVPLPIKLDFLGMQGCEQLVSTELVFPTLTNAAGGAILPLPIPNDTGLRGAKLYFQWWAQDVKANPANLVASNGMELMIR